jgi:hypothetical protein
MQPFPLLREHSGDVCLVPVNHSTECFCLNRQVQPLRFRVVLKNMFRFEPLCLERLP